ncbi:MAG: hypothetical protein KDD60_10800, partial [Bdellovibrionales bacterium]|nr:hypothetical protein [Bdellovibrionales bacterium]
LISSEILPNRNFFRVNRLAMIALGGIGILIALCNISLVTLWFLAGTIRLCAFGPTVSSILNPNQFLSDHPSKRSAAQIIGLSATIGGAVFIYGILFESASMRTYGMALSLILSVGMSFRPKLELHSKP